MLNIEFISLQGRMSTKYPNFTNANNILNYFKDKEWISVDTETKGFDPFTKELLSIQLGDVNKQFVVDLATMDIKLFKGLLETKKLILQNGKFDLRFLYLNNIFPIEVYDTYLAEVKLTQGIKNTRRNLQALEDKYCNTNYVDKSNRGLIHRQGFTDTVIEYCGGDVAVLSTIKDKQLKKAEELNLTKAIKLENKFSLVLAYTEFCGLYLDEPLWNKKVEESTIKLKAAKIKLNEYLKEKGLTKYIDTQLNLFDSEVRSIINWNSEKQVIPLFKELGIDVSTIKDGEVKESVEYKILAPQQQKFDILPLYLEYKKFAKDVSTYGYGFLKHINPVTKRVHTSFTQIVDTGRMASGGKQGKFETPNLQNIPADDTRKCFIAQYDNTTLINADYTGQEQIVLANKSKDKDLIAFYKSDLGDMHSFVCSKIYPELKDIPLKEIKTNYKDKRQIAKAAGFAINYGGTGYTIANNLGISQKEGNDVEAAYFEAFPGLKEYFDECERITLNNGYILIDDKLGSKYFIENFEDFQELHKQYSFDNRKYWDKYKIEKANDSYWYLQEKENVSHYFRWKGALRRMSLNFPIQGTSASITKLAGIYFFDWIKENNYLNKVKIVNIIHDEIMCEVPKELSQEVQNNLKECMERAGNFYCPLVPLKAEPQEVEYWSH